MIELIRKQKLMSPEEVRSRYSEKPEESIKKDWDSLSKMIEIYLRKYEIDFGIYEGSLEVGEFTVGGEPKGLHYDIGLDENGIIISPIQMVFMINDDYNYGGYLEFPKQELRDRLEAGDLVIFPSGFLYPHQVTPYIGKRVAIYPEIKLMKDKIKRDHSSVG